MYKAYYEIDDESCPDRVVQVSVTRVDGMWVPEVQDIADFQWIGSRCRVSVDHVGYLDCGPCESKEEAIHAINEWLEKREHRPWRVLPESINDWS